jgi:hypothetical protein
LFISPLCSELIAALQPQFQGFWRRHQPGVAYARPLGPQSVITPHTGILTRSHLLKPEMVWGCCLPPGVLPGCGPAGIPMHPNRTRLGGSQTAQSCWAAGSLDPQGIGRPPLSRPRHLGDPRPALVQSSGLPPVGGQPNTRRGFLAVYMDWRLGIYRRLTLSVWRFLCFLSLLFKLCMPRLLVVANPPQRGLQKQ